MAATSKKVIHHPFVIISPLLWKICGKNVESSVMMSMTDSYDRLIGMVKSAQPIVSLKKYPLCENPINVKFDANLNIHDIRSVWEQHLDFISDFKDEEVLPSMSVGESKVPFLTIQDSRNIEMGALDEFIQKILDFERSSELRLSDRKSYIDMKYLSDHFVVVLNYRLVVERFQNSFLNFFQSQGGKISVEVRNRIINSFKIMFKKICKFLVFRFCNSKYQIGTRICNFLNIDGSSILTTNPLLTLFFFFSFAPKSFSNQEFNNINNIKAVGQCIKAMVNEKTIFPIYNYFILVRSESLPQNNVNYQFGDFKCPKAMTVSTLRRMTILSQNTKETEIQYSNNRAEYVELKKNQHNLSAEKKQRMSVLKKYFQDIQTAWNMSYYQYFDGEKTKSVQLMNFFKTYKTNCTNPDFVQNQIATNNCIQLLNWEWINRVIDKAKKESRKPQISFPALIDDDHHDVPTQKDDDHHPVPIKEEKIDTSEKPKRKYNRKPVAVPQSSSSSVIPQDSVSAFGMFNQTMIQAIESIIDRKNTELLTKIHLKVDELKLHLDSMQTREIQSVIESFANVNLTDNNSLLANICREPQPDPRYEEDCIDYEGPSSPGPKLTPKIKKKAIKSKPLVLPSVLSQSIKRMRGEIVLPPSLIVPPGEIVSSVFGDLSKDYSSDEGFSSDSEFEEEDDDSYDSFVDDTAESETDQPKAVLKKPISSSSRVIIKKESKLPIKKNKLPDDFDPDSIFEKDISDLKAKRIYIHYPPDFIKYKNLIISNVDTYHIRHETKESKKSKNFAAFSAKKTILQKALACAIGPLYCIGNAHKPVWVFPTGFWGEEFFLNYDELLGAETNPFLEKDADGDTVFDVKLLEEYLGVRKEITKFGSNRIKLRGILQNRFRLRPELEKLFKRYANHKDYLICHTCKTRGPEVFKTDQCNVVNPPYDKNANMRAFARISDLSPEPIANDYFDRFTEWCYNCNNGFYWSTGRINPRPEYFMITPSFDCIEPEIIQQLYYNTPQVNVFLKVPTVSCPKGSSFCSAECKKEFTTFNVRLEKFIQKEKQIVD